MAIYSVVLKNRFEVAEFKIVVWLLRTVRQPVKNKTSALRFVYVASQVGDDIRNDFHSFLIGLRVILLTNDDENEDQDVLFR